MKNCIVFVTHKLSKGILTYLEYLQTEVRGLADLVIMYDNSTNRISPEDFPNLSFYMFDSNSSGFFFKGDRRLPCPFVPLLDFQKQSDYEHYLLMENDIVLKGSFRKFVSKLFDDYDVDYVHIAKDVCGGPEGHWPIDLNEKFPYRKIYFSWCHMYYCSKDFMTCLSNEYCKNNTVFYEFFLPSVAYNKHFIVKQFENYGYDFRVSWGPAEEYEQMYCLENARDVFYHPIKNLGMIDFDGLKRFD